MDGPPALGDFAGVLRNPFGTAEAGGGYFIALSAGPWDGRGSRDASATMSGATSGGTGSLALLLDGAVSGDVFSRHALTLAGLTVANSASIAPAGACLLFDDGRAVATTAAVPDRAADLGDAERWPLAAGLGLLSLRLRRRT